MFLIGVLPFCLITEPLNVTVQILNLTSVKVCWHRPRYGRVRKYELRYGSKERPNEHERKLIHRSQETGRQCTRLRSLASFAENWMEIRAWDPPDPGVPIRINFRMEKDSKAHYLLLHYLSQTYSPL